MKWLLPLLLLTGACTKQAPVNNYETLVGIVLDNEDVPLYPERLVEWQSPPKIFVCKNKSPVSLKRVTAVIDSMTELGLEKNMFWPELRECTIPCEHIAGAILITGPGCVFDAHPDVDASAWTQRFDNGKGSLSSARIEMKGSSKLLLKHEMAHAYGWGHSSLLDHLLNPYEDYMGELITGMINE